MANQEHLDILKQGVEVWNRWKIENSNIQVDLSGADLSETNLGRAILSRVNLRGANLRKAFLDRATLRKAMLSQADLSKAQLYQAELRKADLSKANLSWTNLIKTDLRGANLAEANLRGAHFGDANLSGVILSGVNLSEVHFNQAILEETIFKKANLTKAFFIGANLNKADLSEADLSEADLRDASLIGANLCGTTLIRANLTRANLSKADLTEANLKGADLNSAILVMTILEKANLTDCYIHGISVWNVKLEGAIQDSLVITAYNEPIITVDNLKIAQFIYLLLDNQEIRDVIDTIAKKAVLILGRFTPERKAVLDALREALRTQGYLPILFDFDKPSSQDFTETVSTLAHLSRFIVADLTDPSSIPQELYAIVPHRMVPVQPLLKESEHPNHPSREYSMFIDLRKKYHWVLSTHRYRELEDLLTSLQTKVIEPAEQKAQELEKR